MARVAVIQPPPGFLDEPEEILFDDFDLEPPAMIRDGAVRRPPP